MSAGGTSDRICVSALVIGSAIIIVPMMWGHPSAMPGSLYVSLREFGVPDIAASVFGGRAVGGFSDVLVTSQDQAGYPKMLGALVLGDFASAGALVMLASAQG